MDKPLSVHEKKATKPKRNNKPVKVVYISNPMKVKTTASEFRALVQELTGRDSGPPDPAKYSEIDDPDHHEMMNIKEAIISDDDDDHDDDDRVVLGGPRRELSGDNCEMPIKRSDLTFEPYDDVFVPHQMVESFSGFFPSNLFYESPHVDVLRSL